MKSMRVCVFVSLLASVLIPDHSLADQTRLLPSPCRLMDSRLTTTTSATGYSVKVRGNPGPGSSQGGDSGCGAPTYSVGVILNVISVNSTSSGHAKLWSADLSEPSSSVLNYTSGETTNDGLVVGMSPWSGATYDITWKSSSSTSLVIDLIGWISPDIETVVGEATGLFTSDVLTVETLEGDIIKVFSPGTTGDPIHDDWSSQVASYVGSCVVIHGYWYDGVPPLGHHTFELRSLPLILSGECRLAS